MRINTLISMVKNRFNRENIYCLAEYWDSKAREHQGDAISMWPNNHLNYHYHREQLSVFEELFPDISGMKVLDVGCGTGRISRYLVQRGANVTGIDFSDKTIEVARQKPLRDLCYQVKSVFDLDIQDEFDLVVCWGSVTVACRNRKELHDVLRRLRRSLNATGKLFFLEPVHKGLLHRVLDMDLKEFCEIAKEVGLQPKCVCNLHFWPMRLALSYVHLPRIITTLGYYAGENFMKIFNHKAFGDYKAIIATIIS